jgi:hypothetical protein
MRSKTASAGALDPSNESSTKQRETSPTDTNGGSTFEFCTSQGMAGAADHRVSAADAGLRHRPAGVCVCGFTFLEYLNRRTGFHFMLTLCRSFCKFFMLIFSLHISDFYLPFQ